MFSYFFYCWWRFASHWLKTDIDLYWQFRDEWAEGDAEDFEKIKEWKYLIDKKIADYNKARGN